MTASATAVLAAPTVALDYDSGFLNTDRITNSSLLRLTGVEAGATVQYQVNGGAWQGSYTPPTADDTYTVAARQIDRAGNASEPSANFVYTLDTTAPALIVPRLHDDTGTYGDDRITRSAAIDPDGGVGGGSVEPGATVWYNVYQKNYDPWAWRNSYQAPTVDGTYTVIVRQLDLAGNGSPLVQQIDLGKVSFTLDTTASAPTLELGNDTGTSATDRITRDGTLRVGGIETGATLQYQVNGGAWQDSYTPATTPGTYTVAARQIDLAGNTSAVSSIVYDTAAAAPTVALANDTGTSATDRITRDGALRVGGIETGATVQYQVNGGAWQDSYTPATTPGTYTVAARQIDLAGNISAASANLVYTLDTAAAPTVALANDTGTSTTDRITRDGTLRVGGIETGATVQYQVNGGAWQDSYTPPTADGTYTVAARQIDRAGNIGESSSFVYTLDTMAASPTLWLVRDTGWRWDDGITQAGSIRVRGIETGATLQYQVNGGAWQNSYAAPRADGTYTVAARQIDLAGNTSAVSSLVCTIDTAAAAPTVTLASGQLQVGGVEDGAAVQYRVNGGAWQDSYTPPTADGTYTVAARQIDLAGNISAASANLVYTLDLVATPTIALASDTGSSATDRITRDGTLRFGGIEAGATVQYRVNGGAWQDSYTPPTADGTYTVAVRQIDIAGKTSAVSDLVYTRDTAAAAPTVTLANDTGASGSDRLTQSGQLQIAGVEVGARLQYRVNGKSWSDSYSPPTRDGVYTVAVRQIDAAGNTSDASARLVYTRDATAPKGRLLLDTDTHNIVTETGEITVFGALERGATVEYRLGDGAWSGSYTPPTRDGEYVVSVRQVDRAGNAGKVTSAFFMRDTGVVAPQVSLLADTGADNTDRITRVGGLWYSNVERFATLEYRVNGSNAWSRNYEEPTADGVYTLAVRQIDLAGHTSEPSADFVYTLDKTAPAVIMPRLHDDTGAYGNDLITRSAAIDAGNGIWGGSVEAGAKVQYQVNHQGWADPWAWRDSYQAPTEDGRHHVWVRQIDRAGNVSQPGGTFYFTLDTTPAAAPTLELGNDTGSSDTDRITRDGAIRVGGVEAGATVQYQVNGGAWQDAPPTADGTYTVAVRQIDIAGNASAASADLVYTLDTYGPTPTFGTAAGDNTILLSELANGVTVTGHAEANASVQVTWAGTSLTANSDATGLWSAWFAPKAVPWSGESDIYATATDFVGNTGMQSRWRIHLDTDGLRDAWSTEWGFGQINVAKALAVVTGNVLPDAPALTQVMWGQNWIGAAEAWQAGYTGRGAVVAVLDTGINEAHPALAANIWRNIDEVAGNGIDDDHNGYVDDITGWNTYSHNADNSDRWGHGTPVAGIIGATSNYFNLGNLRLEMKGVAPGVQLMNVKVLGADNGSGTDSSLAEGIRYAADNGANVINLSLASNSFSENEFNAVKYAEGKGVAVIMAASNDGEAHPDYPAYSAWATGGIVAGALSSPNHMADFSNRAGTAQPIPGIDASYNYVVAPGVGIASPDREGGYTWFNGTSAAAPVVSGAMALLMSARDDWRQNWSTSELETILVHTAAPLLA